MRSACVLLVPARRGDAQKNTEYGGSMTSDDVKNELLKIQDPVKAIELSRFFKTGKGQYGEGDVFLGIRVPDQRKTARKFTNIELKDLTKLLSDPVHECRLTALLILVNKYEKNESDRQKIMDFYIENISFINNWDLVDLSAPKIPGHWLYEKERKLLFKLAASGDLWKQRIAVLSTYYFIKKGDFSDTFSLSELLLTHEHDLIHKAVGWMLREIGKIDEGREEIFLKLHYTKMPRTMLRYAIERFEEEKRQKYLKGYI